MKRKDQTKIKIKFGKLQTELKKKTLYTILVILLISVFIIFNLSLEYKSKNFQCSSKPIPMDMEIKK